MFSGERLKAIRKDRRLTLAQLSEVSGLSRTALSRLETDKINLNTQSLIALCISLKTRPEVLFGSRKAYHAFFRK